MMRRRADNIVTSQNDIADTAITESADALSIADFAWRPRNGSSAIVHTRTCVSRMSALSLPRYVDRRNDVAVNFDRVLQRPNRRLCPLLHRSKFRYRSAGLGDHDVLAG